MYLAADMYEMHLSLLSTIIIPILVMRHREVKSPVQSHTA